MKTIKASTRRKNIPDAIVDDRWFYYLSAFKWNVTNKKGTTDFYYHTRIRGQWIKMHHLIIGKGIVDHINHVTHDNRAENLRFASRSLNQVNRLTKNKTGARGVFKNKNRYDALIKVNGEVHYLGKFDTVDEAKQVYNEAAVKYFGEFAILN